MILMMEQSFLTNTKAVLIEARLQRLRSPVSSGYGNRKNAAYNWRTNRASNSTKSKNISNKSIDVTVHDARSSRATSCHQSNRSSSRSLFSAEGTLDVDDILRELKQVKSNLMKDIEHKRSKGGRRKASLTDTEINSIQSFMKACDLMLQSFDMQPQHDAECEHFERYERRQTTRRRRSCVKFDLSQNEFFSY